ncbi:MAG: PIN domain-containing protein [Acidobacteria bacterium]|nr:PIN domain-containing protein [Acidobacteriota bacterium]
MPRTFSRPGSFGKPGRSDAPPKPAPIEGTSERRSGNQVDLLIVRLVFTACSVAACYFFEPFHLPPTIAAAIGLAFSLAVILFEIRVKRASMKRLIGAAIGSVLGILGAYLITLVVAETALDTGTRSFLGIAVLLVMTYIGLTVGATKGDMLNLQALGGLFGAERTAQRTIKLLDTSVIIDGRVADIFEAQFLDGTILIPQFVLRELQQVADSADSMRRQRGRRGLEVLQRIQKMPQLQVEIIEENYPNIPEVDLKLIEMAKRHEAKIVTNDFNLNKVASLQGIDILNVNELANALKPVVLPGEPMRVFILREGKEYNQGVAYLDDGTMVVVDGARKMINRHVDISVTSVHQTTAGKMIFGRFDDRNEPHAPQRFTPQQPSGRSAEIRSESRDSNAPETNGRADDRAPKPVQPETSRE